MVKRYPHIAIVTIEVEGEIVKGEYVEGSKDTIEIKGRYDPAGDARIVIKRNALGDEKQVSGYFYTKVRPVSGNVTRLVVESLGIDVPVICWEPYQSHSIICV